MRWFRRKHTLDDLIDSLKVSNSSSFPEVIRYWRGLIPCEDCDKIYDYRVMSFDHLDRGLKKGNVVDIAKKGDLGKLLDEIEKCELVCLNCHSLREQTRNEEPATVADLKRRLFNGMKLG